MEVNKALFLGLDGVVIETISGEDYPIERQDWEFKQGILPVIRSYYNKGYNVIVVSNQPRIEECLIDEEAVRERITDIVQEIEGYVHGEINFAYCRWTESYYTKPNPGMAYKFATELELNLRESTMIGKGSVDNEFAKNAYIGTYLEVEDCLRTTYIS